MLINKMKACIIEVMNMHLRKTIKEEGTFSEWDGIMKRNWNKLINPPLIYKNRSQGVGDKCKWEPAPNGWAKINFDGASRGNPGKSGIGCIIKKDTGKWIVKRASYIKNMMNNLVELRALQEGFRLSIKLGIKRIIIEGDSQIVLNALRKRNTPNWVLNSKLEEVLKLFDLLEETIIKHIFKEGN